LNVYKINKTVVCVWQASRSCCKFVAESNGNSNWKIGQRLRCPRLESNVLDSHRTGRSSYNNIICCRSGGYDIKSVYLCVGVFVSEVTQIFVNRFRQKLSESTACNTEYTEELINVSDRNVTSRNFNAINLSALLFVCPPNAGTVSKRIVQIVKLFLPSGRDIALISLCIFTKFYRESGVCLRRTSSPA